MIQIWSLLSINPSPKGEGFINGKFLMAKEKGCMYIHIYICCIHRNSITYTFMYIRTCISYINTGKITLPDLYTWRPSAYTYIRQSTSAYVITNTYVSYTSGTLKICPNLENVQLLYIVTGADYDSGDYFNISIMFANISMMFPIVIVLIMGLYSHW